MKIRTTVYVEDYINRHAKENKINISEFLEKQYCHCYLDIEQKVVELQNLIQKTEILKNQIRQAKLHNMTLYNNLTNKEKLFIEKIPKYYREGKTWNSLLLRFNKEFQREFTLENLKISVNMMNSHTSKSSIDSFNLAIENN